MKKKNIFFVFSICFLPALSYGATCSQANLTRCLDSVCAINVSSNPAARCQYCGTASAGTPPTKSGMKSLSLGQSAKYTLSEDELEKAPTDPGKRYAWATAECIKKIEGCTADDVSDTYDQLIEQSCKAAGISAQMAVTRSEMAKTVSSSSCETSIRACIVDEKRCGPDYSACKNDTDFNNFFSSCSVEVSGCDSYISDIRNSLISARDTAIANAAKLLENIQTAYQNARTQKLASVENGCKDDAAFNACVKTVCATNMPNKCEVGTSTEKSENAAAAALCDFYKTACNLLK